MAHAEVRAGKVIAIHLSFRSRAEQRGRFPAHPSYFLKPSSSIAQSGSTIERPAGTELLAFEGEIALIIGRSTRNVSADEAWDHVASVTAANDFGLYDLRAIDKGSNLRSKGRDGYTPIGPHMIDARSIDPASIRVRTWVNGELRQDDTTAGLLFSLGQIVADLSQHLTLHPGDVVLTGTPAGSSVVQPGDIVEVEVDSPAAAGAPSSGKLTTTVIQGQRAFDPLLGGLPSIDDEQRAEAWGFAVDGPVEGQSAPAMENGLAPELVAMLRQLPTSGLSAQLRKRGINACVIEGVFSPRRGVKMVGTAKTLRFVPLREDLFDAHGGGFNAQKRAFDEVQPGQIIVIEARGETGSGTLGDVLALRALSRQAAGIVTDGGVRDSAAVVDVDIPVFSHSTHPAVLGRRHVPWEVDGTIACGNATVQPGDIIVGDDDGVIVIPPSMAHDVAHAALAQEQEEAWVAARVMEGEALHGLFPMNSEWRRRYDADRSGQEIEQ